MNETWAPIPDYPGYESSDQGRVRSIDRVVALSDGRRCRRKGKYYTGTVARGGYIKFNILGIPRGVHCLVLEAFVGTCPEGMEGCHNNGNPADNRLVNLRWGTRASNARDVVRHGRHNYGSRLTCPKQHLLQEPNLVHSLLLAGRRGCLACARARARVHKHKSRGTILDFTAVADEQYRKIMKMALT